MGCPTVDLVVPPTILYAVCTLNGYPVECFTQESAFCGVTGKAGIQ